MPRDILVTHTKPLNKIRNLLVIMSCLDMESSIISILKDASDIAKVLEIKGSGTLKMLIIYQDCSTSICGILLHMILVFETFQVV